MLVLNAQNREKVEMVQRLSLVCVNALV